MEQKEKLQKTLRESQCPHVRERVLIILLMDDGKTYHEISQFLGIAYRTVAYWAIHGDPDNLESFIDKRNQGNFKKVTDEYINLLLAVIEKNPEELGYEFGRWTAARLASYLEKETGICLSGSQVRRILQKKKYVYLWAKYSLEDKQNPVLREAFKEKLQEYIKISIFKPNSCQIWFWDEAGFSLRVIRRKQWSKKGTRRKVAGQRRRGRVNVMGGLRYTDKKRLAYFIEKGNAITFYEQMVSLNEFVLSEWVIEGNQADKFVQLGPKIIVILDNASFHKKKEILAQIEKQMPNIRLEFLPPYSPDYNLMELVWHSAKEYIANKLFESVEQLKFLLDKLLNQGELIIKWRRKIKNKGNSVYAI
ncbi:IS630 family transposase [Gloeothece verrucosa]|uniref:Transposase n=1 Tax=Gloeothece verrucosa (strain PCC 7822) TaxID=497965 RepID=E0UM00_GLOV7|nr:IS630 family transposase [Gloeothece verrucosa]ADN17980.1 transposase [Gloeothece verrucosa PCC 7822]